MFTPTTAANLTVPHFVTIRQAAKTGILPEHTIRRMVKSGEIRAVYSGNRALLNYEALLKLLNDKTDGEGETAAEG